MVAAALRRTDLVSTVRSLRSLLDHRWCQTSAGGADLREVLADEGLGLCLEWDALQGGAHGVEGAAYAGHCVGRVAGTQQVAPEQLTRAD